MLLSFGAKNFFCFKQWAEISLKCNSRVPLEITHGDPAVRSLCFKGANASGKTNGLKILSFLSYFCTDSFSQTRPDEEIPIEPFFNRSEPIEFFIDFMVDDIEYSYELSLTKTKVLIEKIYRKVQKRALILDRRENEMKVNTLSKRPAFGLRTNASVISTAIQYEKKEFRPIYEFFKTIVTNVTHYGLRVPLFRAESESIASDYFNNREYLDFTSRYLKTFDTGIERVEVKEELTETGKRIYLPFFIHKRESEEHELSSAFESSGTKHLFYILFWYKKVLDSGGVLVLDEFDINLHPDILPHLVKLFENSETNPKEAQLIFSTHNNEILEEMGKYRTYLFNKEENESYCYRMDELNPAVVRPDRPIRPVYESGVLGGVPRI